MKPENQALIVAALECYARKLESDACKAGLGTSSAYQLVREASLARQLQSFIQHGSKI